MTIASEIEKLNTNLGNSYTAVASKGGTVPSSANFDNLATAIGTITELKGETRSVSLMNKNGTTYTPTSGKNGITSITVTPRNKSLSITPSTSSQSKTVPTNYSGYGTVTVSAVTSSIDSNITAGNIKKDITILGVTGSYEGGSPSISSLSVTPTTSAQTITAPSGTDGYNPISVSAVTSSIDSNITAGNIKNGVTILGVTGTYGGGGAVLTTKTISTNGTYNASSDNADGYSSVTVNVASAGEGWIPRAVTAGGVYGPPTTGSSFTFALPSTATNVSEYGLYKALSGSTKLTSVDLSSLTTLSNQSALQEAFSGCTFLTTVDLSSLTTVSASNALHTAFATCSRLSSVDLSSLTTVSGQGGMSNCFNSTALTSIDLSSLTSAAKQGLYGICRSCTSLATVDLSALATIGESTLEYAFYQCTSLETVNFTALSSLVSANAMRYAFQYCTKLKDVYFNSLTTTSFGSVKTQFTNMLSNTGSTVTHTLHFPSDLSSKISELTGYPTFGGTSGYVTLSFDLAPISGGSGGSGN